MNKQIEQVTEFHNTFKIPILKEAYCPPDRVELRHNILQEEVNELYKASKANDAVEVGDAITDCLYVLIGTALEFGMHSVLEKMFDEVHRSNMSKLDENGKVILREDGKIMKSSLYFKPNLEYIIMNEL